MIYINGRFLSQKISGVQRFGREIIFHLSKITNEIKVLVPNNTDINGIPENLCQVVGSRDGHMWEQIDLLKFMKGKDDILLNLTNTAPLLYNKNVFTLHDVIFLYYPESYSIFHRMYYKFSVGFHLKSSKLILTVSEYSKKSILKNYPKCDEKKIKVIYNAVPKVFNNGLSFYNNLEIKNYCVLSSFDNNKNLQVVIDAFKINKRPDIRLLILGSHVQKHPNLLAKALEDPRIVSYGHVTDEKLAEIYQTTYAFIIPSKLEGFGIPPLEAQSFGCPVLASESSCLPEILGNSALYFDPDRPENLSVLIDFISDNIDQRNLLVKKSLENVKRFDFSYSANLLLSLIKGL